MSTNSSLAAKGFNEHQRQRYWELMQQIDIILLASPNDPVFKPLKTALEAL